MSHRGSAGKVSTGRLEFANGCGLNIGYGILLTRPCQQLSVLSHPVSHTSRICAAKAPSSRGSLWGGYSQRHKYSVGNCFRNDLDLFLDNKNYRKCAVARYSSTSCESISTYRTHQRQFQVQLVLLVASAASQKTARGTASPLILFSPLRKQPSFTTILSTCL